VYFPLYGDASPTLQRHYFNLVITFAVSGLWHGANWTFVTWGIYYGVVLVIEGLVGKWWGKNIAWTVLRRLLTLTIILVAFVFFRAQSLSQAVGILRRIAVTTSFGPESVKEAILLATGESTALSVMGTTLLLTGLMFAIEAMQEYRLWLFKPPITQSVKWQALAVVLLFQGVILFGSLRASSFIYFQF
jgi:alginate O-acetyltransferase complex protein AlgI